MAMRAVAVPALRRKGSSRQEMHWERRGKGKQGLACHDAPGGGGQGAHGDTGQPLKQGRLQPKHLLLAQVLAQAIGQRTTQHQAAAATGSSSRRFRYRPPVASRQNPLVVQNSCL